MSSTGVPFFEYGEGSYQYLRIGDEPVEPINY